MPSPAAPFKVAEDAALRASAALVQAMGGSPIKVYSDVPANAVPPYITIDQVEIDDLSDGCGEAHSIVATVQWWANRVGAVKGADTARNMGAAIIAALNTDTLAIEGHDTVLAIMEIPERYSTDPDGSSRGLVGFRYETTAQDS